MISEIDLFNSSKDLSNSWAVWPKTGDSTLPFFLSNLNALHVDIVFLGYQHSEEVKTDFINFHNKSSRGDNRLKMFFKTKGLDRLKGAFMTNLFDPTKNKSFDKKIAVDQLKQKMKFYAANLRKIICIGDNTFEDVCSGLDINYKDYEKQPGKKNLRLASVKVGDETWKIFRVYKHSSYGNHQKLGDIELPAQLKYINDLIF